MEGLAKGRVPVKAAPDAHFRRCRPGRLLDATARTVVSVSLRCQIRSCPHRLTPQARTDLQMMQIRFTYAHYLTTKLLALILRMAIIPRTIPIRPGSNGRQKANILHTSEAIANPAVLGLKGT